jgi:DUF4097 and DUF4098 domain-containing protein YvlB
MIAAPALLCALLAQTTPPLPSPPVPPRPPERRLHGPRVHVPRIEIPEFDLDMDDLDFSGVDLSGLRTGLERMREDLSRAQRDLEEPMGRERWFVARADPQDEDDDDDDDDQAQEERDHAREERERAHDERQREVERSREQAQKVREHVREQQERARELQQQARERAREQQDRAREQQDRFREQEDRSREDRRRFRYNFHFGDEEDDQGTEMDPNLPATRATAKNGVATLPAKGPVTLRVRAQSGEVEIVASDRAQVAASLSDVPSKDEIQLSQSGDRVNVQVGRKALRRGKLRVELPKGSSLDFESTSADLHVQGIGGDVRIQTMSGDIQVSGVRKANVETISGDVKVDANGPVRLHTVSGNAVASTVDPGVRLEFESASGNLDWTGACGKGCHVSTETVSGQIAIAVDPRSSFELSYSSHSGDFKNDLNLDVKRAPKKKHGGTGGWLEAVYGKGEGVIECDAFSGDLQIRKK